MKKFFFVLFLISSVCIVQGQEKAKISPALKKQIKEEILRELKTDIKYKERKSTYKRPAKKGFFKKGKQIILNRVRLSGKGLLRLYEQDWNQKSYSGKLNDRYWSRYNFYLNIDTKFNNMFALHARIRTGNKQYSFITFGGQIHERFGIMLDQFYLDIKKGNYWAKIGRQSAGSVWINQKGSQFDIPTHDGISIGAKYKIKNINITPKVAYFDEYYRNNTGLSDHGRIYGFTITADQSKDNMTWKVQSGLLNANDLPERFRNYASDTADGEGIKYHDGFNAPDYHIWTNHVNLSLKEMFNLTFSGDFYLNLSNYKINPTNLSEELGFTDTPRDASKEADFTDEKLGYVATVSVGGLSKPKDWYVGLSYLYMQKYAAIEYFAQYDYARWAATNIKGPELKAGYRINKFMVVQSRLFLTQEIKGEDGNRPNFVRSGNRFRLDLNFNF